MNRELKFILDILQDKPSIPEKDFDWYYILGFLELNKISGYFFIKTKEFSVHLPQSVEQKLSNVLKIQQEQNLYMRQYIQNISDKLRQEKIRYSFLNGSVLSNTNFQFSEKSFSCMAMSEQYLEIYRRQSNTAFYGTGERISSGIDILVEEKNFTALSEMLKSMGFVQGYYNFRKKKVIPLLLAEIFSGQINRRKTAPFVLETENAVMPFVKVNINFSLDYLPDSHENMIHTILKESINFAGNIRGGILSLKVDDFFLHLITRQYKQSILYSMVQSNKDTELYKLLDIYLFIKKGYIELSSLYNKIKKFQLEKPVYSVMGNVSNLFNDFCFSDYSQMFRYDNSSDPNMIIDFATGRKFAWKKTLSERLIFFDKEQFLQEVRDE